jgi:hypothetical protein
MTKLVLRAFLCKIGKHIFWALCLAAVSQIYNQTLILLAFGIQEAASRHYLIAATPYLVEVSDGGCLNKWQFQK